MAQTDGKIYEVMAAIQTYLGVKLAPMIKRIELYEGAYDDKGVMRMVTSEGVAHLGFLGASNITEMPGGPAIIYASFGIYLAAVGNARIRNATNRLEGIAVTLLKAGHDEDPGLGVTYAMPIIIGDIDNLYNAEAGKQGVSIFGLSFAVPILLGESITGSDFEEIDPSQWTIVDQNDEVILDLNAIREEDNGNA